MLTIGIGERLQRWERYDHASPENDKRWIFHLRKGVKFHAGSDFTADDVVWNFKKVRETQRRPTMSRNRRHSLPYAFRPSSRATRL
jgi:ABC-type transport system substrate-binding protein